MPPLPVSWRCRGGWGKCYPFINRCCSWCLCLLCRSAPTMICCCWTQTICWSTWLLRRERWWWWWWGQEKGDSGYWQRIWTWRNTYFLSKRFELSTLYENNDFFSVATVLCDKKSQISLWIKRCLNENGRPRMNVTDSSVAFRCHRSSIAKVSAML